MKSFKERLVFVLGIALALIAGTLLMLQAGGLSARQPVAAATLAVSSAPASAVRSGVPRNALGLDVSGEIVADTVWSLSDSPVLLEGQVVVTDGVTLTIQPGVVVKGKFKSGAGYGRLIVWGHLDAQGTEALPIVFTSNNDSAIAQWEGIVFEGGTGNLDHIVVRHAGKLSSTGCGNVGGSGVCVKNVSSGEVTIKNSTFMTNGNASGDDYGVLISNSHVTISNTEFVQNGTGDDGGFTGVDYAVYAGSAGSTIKVVSNTFDNNNAYAIGVYPGYVSELVNNTFTGANSLNLRILLAGDTVPVSSTLRLQPGLYAYELPKTDDVTVPDGVTVTVQPGVRVMATNELLVEGHLSALGTTGQPITFTSKTDTGPEQWQGLVFNGGTGDLREVTVRYAGKYSSLNIWSSVAVKDVVAGSVNIESCRITKGSYSSSGTDKDYGLYIENSQVLVSDTLFLENGTSDELYDFALYVEGDTSVVSVTHNTFQDNAGYAIRIPPKYMNYLVGNVYTDTADVDWIRNRIVIDGDEIPVDGTLYTALGLEGYEFRGTVLVPSSVTMTVQPGVIVMGGKNGTTQGELKVSGSLIAEGTPAQPVLFTSATDTAPEQWAGLVFDGGTGRLSYSTIRYAGGLNTLGTELYSSIAAKNAELHLDHTLIISGFHYSFTQSYDYGIYADNSEITLDNTVIRKCGDKSNQDIGLYVTGAGADVTLMGSRIEDNTGTGIKIDNGSVSMVCGGVMTNTQDGVFVSGAGQFSAIGAGFFNNGTTSGRGINNMTSVTATATYNWWGDVSGPTHTSNPGGTGESISDYVEYTPWLDRFACLADLEVSKTAMTDTVLAGTPLTYTIVVSNAGPSPATQLVISDPLQNMTYISTTVSQGSGCQVQDGTVVCELDTLPKDMTATVTLIARPKTEGTAQNKVTVFAYQEDITQTNNTAAVTTTTVLPSVDLSTLILESSDPVVVNTPLTYTVVISNPGPSNAQNLLLTNTVPSTVTFSAFDTPTCALASSQVVTCAWSTLNLQDNITFTFVVTPDEDGLIDYKATVKAATPDEIAPSDNTAVVTTTIEPAADLQFTGMGISAAPRYVAEVVTYTVRIRNIGPDDAVGVVLTDTLPISLTDVTALSSQGNCDLQSGNLLVCSLGSMPVGDYADLTVTAVPTAAGVFSNDVQVTSALADPDLDNNMAQLAHTILPQADLAIVSFTDTPDPAVVGTVLTYTVVISNPGPSTATGIQLTDTLPVSVVYKSALPAGLCFRQVVNLSDGVICNLGSIQKDEVLTVTIFTTVTHDGVASNQVDLGSAVFDGNLANNTGAISTTLAPAADLQLAVSDMPDNVWAGDLLTYTIEITNAGPDVAHNAAVTGTLPLTVTYMDASSDARCDLVTGGATIIVCDLGLLAVGQHEVFDVVVRPESDGIISHHVEARALEADIHPADNVVQVLKTISPLADLSLQASAIPAPAYVGVPFTYTLIIHNDGPSTAPGIVLTDTLPGSMTYLSATLSQPGNCYAASLGVTCTLSSLASGENLTVALQVLPGALGMAASQVDVRSAALDRDLDNNTVPLSTEILPAADLAVTVTPNRDAVLIGKPLTFTLVVHNAGLSPATGTLLTNTLMPAIVGQVSASQGTCDTATPGLTRCDLGTIAAGESATVTVQVSRDVTGTVTSIAEVRANEFDPVMTNNSDSAAPVFTDVIADLAVTLEAEPNPVVSGGSLTYMMNLQNLDVADAQIATGVQLRQTLPSVVTSPAVTSSSGVCNVAAGIVTCDWDSLAIGASADITVVVSTPVVSATAKLPLLSTVEVTANEADPDLSNNTASVTVMLHGVDVAGGWVYLPVLLRQ